ncbi:glycosyl transferase, group 1 family protein [mine drainage metagenome]|uniref:Glycosyl transferase, group 1 family protein n=1 Tax=mine drainage metagenome TaxID=410659 RepID=T1CZ50_9ZZZZ
MRTTTPPPVSLPAHRPDSGPSPLRILVTCDSHAWGGLEREVVWLSAAWHERNHRVTLYLSRGSRIESEAKTHGLEVLTHSHRGLLRMLDIVRLRGWIRSHRPDIVHAHESRSLRMLSITLPLAKSQSLLYLTRHMGLKHPRRDILSRMLYRRIKRIYAISSYVARGIREHLPISEEQVRILPPGIRHQHFATHPISQREARSQLGLAPDTPVIGMLGRITAMKGHREYLLAMHTLMKQGQSIQGLVAGAADPEPLEQDCLRDVYALRQQLGLDESVHFTGESLDPRLAFAAMDIFAFPSHLESFGMTAVEAMTFGLPVIACAAGGIPDIIEDGQTGILIPPHDPDALAQAITGLLAAPHLRRRIARSAQSSTHAWDIRHIASRYESDFYHDLRTAGQRLPTHSLPPGGSA